MRITLKQIADMAGVHRSTIDKVLHDRKGVSDEVRDRVRKLLDDIGYEPNVIGKALAHQNKPKRVIALLLNVDASNEIKEGIETAYNEIKMFGLKIEYYYCSITDHSKQQELLNMLLTKKIDGLIISPIVDPEIVFGVDRLVESGIPVVSVNTDLPESKRNCFIGQDSIKAGRVAGQLMGEVLQGKGKVAIITGSSLMQSPTERMQGFIQFVTEHYPEIQIVEKIETKEQAIIAFSETMRVLDRDDRLDGILVTCGNVSEVGQAVRLHKNGNKIKMISYDLYPEILKLIGDGTISFSIGQNLKNQGYLSLKVIFEMIFFNQMPSKSIFNTSIDILTRENI